VSGLTSATAYYYRFRHGDTLSPTGTFRTAPAETEAAPVRFVFSGGTDGSMREDGTPLYDFRVLEQALADDPDFFLYVGDTISAGRTSADWLRARYRVNRDVVPLANLLAATSTYAIWDDSEITPDFAGTMLEPDVLDAGYQTFREYLPVAADGSNGLYRNVYWGTAVRIIELDTRSFRNENVAASCTPAGAEAPDVLPAIGSATAPEAYRALRTAIGLPEQTDIECLNALSSPARTMLGEAQRDWLLSELDISQSMFTFIVSPAPISELIAQPYDRWEGYRAERDVLLRFIAEHDVQNVIFLSTDLQAAMIGDVRVDLASSPVAIEAVAGRGRDARGGDRAHAGRASDPDLRAALPAGRPRSLHELHRLQLRSRRSRSSCRHGDDHAQG
jgi:phosphodiesterase/alkaline phosphatase D-like protein